jgi:antitoxin component YwqK of YwqJK toxin-antitoxin module
MTITIEGRTMNMVTRMMGRTGYLAVCLVVFFFLLAAFAVAEERIERDTDKDGKIDQVRVLGQRGVLLRVESDSDHDGRMDRFQYYEKDELVKLGRDMDGDGKTDVTDYFENGKRCRQERQNTRGRIVVLTTFDGNEVPRLMKKDSRERGFFDMIHTFEKGELKTLEQDPDGDGKINITTTYAHNQPVRKIADSNGDGKPEAEVFYDAKGQPEKSRHDLDFDGRMETVRYYENGSIVKQEKDQNSDGKPESVTQYTRGAPVEERKDRNGDGIMDCFLAFDAKGQVAESREHSLTRNRLERIRTFRSGKLLKTTWDGDSDGFLESACLYEQGRLTVQTRDADRNGQPDTWIYFSENGEKLRLESDSRFKGIVDYKLYFKKGEKHKAFKDNDGDGYFETLQEFGGSAWDLVIRTDLNKTRNPETAYFYKGGVLLRMDVDENEDGKADFKEYYSRNGRIERSEEFDPKTGRLLLVWYYDASQNPVRAVQDANGDGYRETVFDYRKGRLVSVTEDRNKDGKPDVWESYDEAEVLVSVRQDLDYDGVPDVVKSKEGTRRLLADGKAEKVKAN